MFTRDLQAEPFMREMRKAGFIDMSDMLRFSTGFLNIAGPCRCGKSTYLSMIRCYLDSAYESIALPDPDQRIYSRNNYRVISADFSDCCAESRAEMMDYLREKMHLVYGSMADYLLGPGKDYDYDTGKVLAILGKSTDEKTLQWSLVYLVHMLTDFEALRKPYVLLDEPERLEIYAKHFGYWPEVVDFLRQFFNIDWYEHTRGMFVTTYMPAGKPVHYDLFPYAPHPIQHIPCMLEIAKRNGVWTAADDKRAQEERHERSWWYNRRIDPAACYELVKEHSAPLSWDYISPLWLDDEQWGPFIQKEQMAYEAWTIEKEREAKEKREHYEKARREEGARELPAEVVIPSPHAGARTIVLPRDRAAYQERNQLLQELYEQYDPKENLETFYARMQHVSDDTLSDFDGAAFWELEKFQASMPERWEHEEHEYEMDRYWAFVHARSHIHTERLYDSDYVKVYVSPREGSYALFDGAVCEMLLHGTHTFHAKVARRLRLDMMCFWVTRADFFTLERYFQPHDEALVRTMPFVAYRGKLGISRELMHSYHYIQAKLMTTYFKYAQSEDKQTVDLEEMYQLFLNGWNYALPEGHPMQGISEHIDASSLIVLLDTLDVVLGNMSIGEDHMLLTQGGPAWHALSGAHSWCAVGKQWERYSNSAELYT